MKATPAAALKGPDPHWIRQAASVAPSRSAGLLSLIHSLIAFGEALIRTLQASPAAGALSDLANRFGSSDLAVIVARITRGLMLASALEERLLRNGTRLDAPRGRAATASGTRKKPPARPPLISYQDDDAALLVRLPTAQEIAARVRSKPIGIVLEGICHDLGITCEHPLWRDLHNAILCNGGSLPEIVNNMLLRVNAPYFVPRTALPAPPSWPLPGLPSFAPLSFAPLSFAPPSLASGGTGPP